MPPRVRLNAEELARLPQLLAQVAARRGEFPDGAVAAQQAVWIAQHYADGAPLSTNLIALLLFEHGVHRSVDQVARDLAILREDTCTH